MESRNLGMRFGGYFGSVESRVLREKRDRRESFWEKWGRASRDQFLGVELQYCGSLVPEIFHVFALVPQIIKMAVRSQNLIKRCKLVPQTIEITSSPSSNFNDLRE